MTYWPGTNIPKSNGNAFTYWKSGAPSRITSSKEWKMSQASALQNAGSGMAKNKQFTIYSKARPAK